MQDRTTRLSFPSRLPTASNARQGGGTLVGFIVGVIAGLGIALVVALAITKGPIPFVNKVLHSSAPTPGDDAGSGKLPDPNKSLYSKEIAIAPVPTYSASDSAAPTVHPEPPSKPAYLQVGAYKNPAEADNAKAKLALMGFEAQISQLSANDQVIYRVRLGPFAKIDEMNRARQRLAESGIEVSSAAATANAPSPKRPSTAP